MRNALLAAALFGALATVPGLLITSFAQDQDQDPAPRPAAERLADWLNRHSELESRLHSRRY